MTHEPTAAIPGFLAKLERRTPLPEDVRAEINELPGSVVSAGAQDVIVEENAEARHCLFVTSGLVTRQKHLKGSPYIMGLGIPGDAVDLQSLWFRRQDHRVVAHKSTTLIAIKHDDIIRACDRSPYLEKVLWHDTLVDAAIFREWTLNVAHRQARFRLAHFLLEVATRQQAHGLCAGDVFELPLTQSELASALGLSLVHLDKSLSALRAQGRVRTEGRIVTIIDRASLEKETAFDPSYLHIATKPQFEAVAA